MIGKLTLLVAFGAGYVLGAKAGQERYAQIAAGAQRLAAQPPVKRATDKASVKASELAEQATGKATAAAREAVGAVKDKVDTDHNDPPTVAPFGGVQT